MSKRERALTPEMAERREEMLQAAFRLFTDKNINAVSMPDVAAETDYTLRTLYRYFATKDDLVVAVAAWSMERFLTQNRKRRPNADKATAAEDYAFFLDSFLTLYREGRDALRFNQFFNVYVQSRRVGETQLRPFTRLTDELRGRFHAVYEKRDGTLRADVPEDEMFSATLHLMLAAVTRYAVGLAYDAGIPPERELMLQRDMLLRQYTIS